MDRKGIRNWAYQTECSQSEPSASYCPFQEAVSVHFLTKTNNLWWAIKPEIFDFQKLHYKMLDN